MSHTDFDSGDLPPDDHGQDRKGRAARLAATRVERVSRQAADPHFSQPVRQVVLMLVVLGLVIAGGWLAYGRILPIFKANPLLNGTILVVFAFGVLTCFWQVAQLIKSVSWIERFAAGKLDYAGANFAAGDTAPRLLAPLAALLGSRGPVGTAISTDSARSIQDSVATRIDEARDITRYLGNLLIFLGLLGTFYGLATTVPAIVETIRTLAPEQGESGVEVFDKLMHGLETQLGGMATAFSSSLLGLAGSLVVGLLELFASHGQNRFYRELEEWLSSFTRIGVSGAEGGLAPTDLADFLGGIGAQLTDLQDFYAQRDLLRDQEASEADSRSLALAGGVERLTSLIGSDRDALVTELASERQAQADSHRRLSEILERLSDGQDRLIDATRAAQSEDARLEDLMAGLEQAFTRLSDGQERMIAAIGSGPGAKLTDEVSGALARITESQQRIALMAQQTPALDRDAEAVRQAAFARALDRMSEGQARLIEIAETRPGGQDDPEARMRLRSIDVQLGRLLEEAASGRDGLIAELREDMAALTRAIRALEGRDGA
ncbi:hypothetical protein RGQ15_11320 [Paracoccus sp. MBLB3053]|uniref:Biopolymer transporter ExbB n=1 Tax=Paracoccus aurantius TaxID=3073814 RepID=A0ABU2HSZ3_9RHOB|nr:hypothetical protein [Paracoccus sp. MBLB3053]MDS9468156.1 hypothetical protein [Paracoccus sp. MBLB3053]